MKLATTLVTSLCLLFCPMAFGGDGVPFVTDFQGDGGDIPNSLLNEDGTEGLSVFRVRMSEDIEQIISLELHLNGLSHDDPWDLDILLVNPFGDQLEIMTDRGDQVAVDGLNMIFRDGPFPLAPENSELGTGPYRPEGAGGFSIFTGTSGGAEVGDWLLLVIDDSPKDAGMLDSFTLRVTAIPEPVTLSLLALGAFAALRRRR